MTEILLFILQAGSSSQGKYVDVTSELKKENTEARKIISEHEKSMKKMSEENRRLRADLDDEKAKVLALADMREDDEGLDLMEPPTPKKTRRSSSKRRGKPSLPPAEEAVKSPAKKKVLKTPKAKSTPASKPKADVAEISSVSKRGRQSKKVAYEEIDIPPIEQEDEEEIIEAEVDLTPKKGKSKSSKSVKNFKKDSEKNKISQEELPEPPPTDVTKGKGKGKGKGAKKTGVVLVEDKDESPPELQPKGKGRNKKESKKGSDNVPGSPQPPQKTKKGKKVKIVEDRDSALEAETKVTKKSQKTVPPAALPQNRKGGIKRKADATENVKPTAAKRGRKR